MMMKAWKGFTLVELMMTLAIASILLIVGVPSFSKIIRNSRTATATNDLVTALHLARSEAVKRGVQITMIKTGSEWEEGWKLITDVDGDGVLDVGDGDEVIGVFEGLSSGFTLRTGSHFNNWMGYLSDGQSRGNGGSNDTFRLCADDQVIANGRSVIINNIGRIRTERGVSSCP